MLRKLSGLFCLVALFGLVSVSAHADNEFPSTQDAVGTRGPGGLDAPSKKTDMVKPPATPVPSPPPKPVKKTKEKSQDPAPASSGGY